jgi:hypothetical protein
VTNTATASDIDGEVFVGGDDGLDTMVIDDRDGLSFDSYVLDTEVINPHTFEFLLFGQTQFGFRNIEVFELDQNSRSTFTHLNSKKPTMELTVFAGNGDDDLFVGGGSFDTNGWSLDTTTLFGGGGNDSIEFHDSLGTVSQPLTVAGFTISRGSWGCTYSAFESLEIRGGNGQDNDRVVTINGPSNFVTETTVNTNNGVVNLLSISPTTVVEGLPDAVNIASGDLAALGGNVSLDLTRRGLETVTINDQNSSVFPSSYEVASTAFVKSSTGQTIPYVGVNALVLNTTPLADSITVSSVAQFMSVTVNSNAGNDTLRIGNGNMGLSLLGPVTMNGGLGTDTGFFANTFDNAPSTQVLNGMSLTEGSLTHGFSGLEALRVNLGPGGSNLTINSISVQTNVTGDGNGNDTFTVGGGDIDSNFPSGTTNSLVIDALGGTDQVVLNDLNDPNLNSYFINTTRLDLSDAGIHWFIHWFGVEAITLNASNGTSTSPGALSTILVQDTAVPLRINGNGGNDWLIVNDATAPVVAHTGLGDKDVMDLNQDFDNVPLTVVIDQNDDIETLDIRTSATLRVTNGATLVKTRATTSPGSISIDGVLDLVGGAFLSRAGGPSLTTFRNQLIAGRNGGSWNGSGAGGAINSSLAAASSLSDGVGYGLGSQIAPTSIGPFSVATGDTLIRYALDGDADLSGNVNLADFNRLAGSFGQANKVWVDGDSNYNGLINLTDFNALAGNFGGALSPVPDASRAPDGRLGYADGLRERLEELS